jgi:hypothetical protein
VVVPVDGPAVLVPVDVGDEVEAGGFEDDPVEVVLPEAGAPVEGPVAVEVELEETVVEAELGEVVVEVELREVVVEVELRDVVVEVELWEVVVEVELREVVVDVELREVVVDVELREVVVDAELVETVVDVELVEVAIEVELEEDEVVVPEHGAPATLGTASGPDPIGKMFELGALKIAGAKANCWLSMSKTTYIEPSTLSPRMLRPRLGGDLPMPNGQSPVLSTGGEISCPIGTLIVTPKNSKLMVSLLVAKEQGI